MLQLWILFDNRPEVTLEHLLWIVSWNAFDSQTQPPFRYCWLLFWAPKRVTIAESDCQNQESGANPAQVYDVSCHVRSLARSLEQLVGRITP